MATRTIELRLTVGAPRPGLWCDVCALPSVFEVGVYVLRDDGPRQVATWAMCTEHDAQPADNPEVPPCTSPS